MQLHLLSMQKNAVASVGILMLCCDSMSGFEPPKMDTINESVSSNDILGTKRCP